MLHVSFPNHFSYLDIAKYKIITQTVNRFFDENYCQLGNNDNITCVLEQVIHFLTPKNVNILNMTITTIIIS